MELEIIRDWIFGSVVVTIAALFWCWRHRHLDGHPVGPLKRIFRLRRVALLMPFLLVAGYSVFVWAICLTPGPYRVLVPVVGLIILGVLIILWNRYVRRLQQQMADSQK
jgi:hypothetical protein